MIDRSSRIQSLKKERVHFCIQVLVFEAVLSPSDTNRGHLSAVRLAVQIKTTRFPIVPESKNLPFFLPHIMASIILNLAVLVIAISAAPTNVNHPQSIESTHTHDSLKDRYNFAKQGTS